MIAKWIVVGSLLLATAGLSQTFDVNSTTAFRQALENAAANGESDEIILNEGVYKTTDDGLGTFSFYDNEEFNLTISSAEGLTFQDVVLEGNKTERVLRFDNSLNSTLILTGISVRNGYTKNSSGAGVLVSQDLVVEGCDISYNVARGHEQGGGIYGMKNVSIIKSLITHNEARAGAGICGSGVIAINDSMITHNASGYSGGGGIYGGVIDINNSMISYNTTTGKGGGFYNSHAITINNSTLSYNESEGSGGGFYCNSYDGGTAFIKNSTISYNTSGWVGGGFVFGTYGVETVVVLNSMLTHNQSKSIAGAFFSAGRAIVLNSILSNNDSEDSCDAVRSGSTYMINSSLIGHTEAICSQGVFVNDLFYKNGVDIIFKGASKVYNNYIDYSKIVNAGYNVIKKDNLQPDSVGDINFGDDNKSLTSTSPVIDKGLEISSTTFRTIYDVDGTYDGNNQVIYDNVREVLKTDIFGNQRGNSGIIDMGPHEFGAQPEDTDPGDSTEPEDDNSTDPIDSADDNTTDPSDPGDDSPDSKGPLDETSTDPDKTTEEIVEGGSSGGGALGFVIPAFALLAGFYRRREQE